MRRRPVRLPTDAQADIRRLHPESRRKVRAELDRLALEPALGKELGDELSGYHRLRVGRLRVVYREIGSEIQVIGVGPRETIYQEVARRIAHEAAHEEKS